MWDASLGYCSYRLRAFVYASMYENGRVPAVCCALPRCTCMLCLTRSMCPFLFKTKRSRRRRDALKGTRKESRGCVYKYPASIFEERKQYTSPRRRSAFTWVFDTTSMLNWFDWLELSCRFRGMPMHHAAGARDIPSTCVRYARMHMYMCIYS